MVKAILFIFVLCYVSFAHASVSIAATNISVSSTKAQRSRNSTLGHDSYSKSQTLKNQARSLFARQECPPGFPELCPDLTCCEANTVCCDDATCCPDAFPVCQPGICCQTGDVSCGAIAPDACAPSDATCCDASGDYCESGELCCGDADPGYCHPGGTTCCDNTGTNCPDTELCCGEYCCNTANNDQCCAGTENGSVCCGQYQTCCDGWCCSEGATCSTEFGYCIPPEIEFDYLVMPEVAENTCLGMRTHPPDVGVGTPNSQILTYGGPGKGQYSVGPCRFKPSCCQGQTGPTGGTLQCDEYPFANSVEGGPLAWAACVNASQNSAQGLLLRNFLRGKHAGFLYTVTILNIDCTTVPGNALPTLNQNCLPLLSPQP